MISKNHCFVNNIFNYYLKLEFPSCFSYFIDFDQVKERNYHFRNTFVSNDLTVIVYIKKFKFKLFIKINKKIIK